MDSVGVGLEMVIGLVTFLLQETTSREHMITISPIVLFIHFEHYGDILFKLGDVNGAVQQWQKARGMNANSETLNKKIANRKMYE